MKRYVVLYLATLVVLIPFDFLFLGLVAKGFFTSQVGDMLGEIRLPPAILFYLLYVAGILIFVSGSPDASWQSTLLYGALFGLFCYATFDLTVAVAAQALDLAGGGRRRLLGIVRHSGVVDARAGDRQLDRAEDLTGFRHCEEQLRRSTPVLGFWIASRSLSSGGALRRPLARNDGGKRHFGCGTIRMYGFGDFQPCG